MKLLAVLSLCLCAWASAGHAQEVTSPRQHANTARFALAKKNYAGAVDAYRAALDGGYHNADIWYGLACAHAMQGQQEQALIALERSVAEGWRAPDELEQDKDLAALHGSPRWTALLRQVSDNERAYRASHASPETFKFLTGDIDLFWKAYEQLPAAPNPAEVLERQYLDLGSPGLHDFVPDRIGSGETLYQSMVQRPKYYAAIRPATLQVVRSEPAVRAAMRNFKAMYDQALFPDVYFVVGAMNSGGTASSHGLLIGTEIFSSGNGVPSDELSPWLKSVVKSSDLLPSIVTHELMHFQQHLDPTTLLGHAIKEGSADFLASLVVQGNFNEHVYVYGYAHEAELKKEFFARMHGTDLKGWLYGGSGLVDGRPADLGYFMGFRICQSYYQRAKDKKKAVAEMLNTKDFKRFLADSGYYSAN